MAAAIVNTIDSYPGYPSPLIGNRTFEIDWTNDSSGTVTGSSITINGVAGPAVFNLSGELVEVEIVGTTHNSNVTLKDAAGVDVLAGLGTGVTAAAPVKDTPLSATNKFLFNLSGPHTFAVASGTASEGGGKLTLSLR